MNRLRVRDVLALASLFTVLLALDGRNLVLGFLAVLLLWIASWWQVALGVRWLVRFPRRYAGVRIRLPWRRAVAPAEWPENVLRGL